ncbi:MAG: hypothetical protein H0T62_00055 [Parachlamydiaceae bacterium]|nr:hypothetical protein [Parachlamydiaceae bacterium]
MLKAFCDKIRFLATHMGRVMFKILSIILLLVVVIILVGSKKTHAVDLDLNDLPVSFQSLVAASEAFESNYALFLYKKI